MTFKHKLSCRLALLRNVVLLGAACAVAACDLQQLLGMLNPVASVEVTPATATVSVGQTVTLAATPKDSTGRVLIARIVTWASSAPAVATVNAGGLVTGVTAGTATITASSEGHSGSAVVTVVGASNAPVASVTVAPATASVGVGQVMALVATLRDAYGNALSGRVVTWVSNAPAVAAVNGSGQVTGMAAGATTIAATSEGQSGSGAITVTAAVTNPAQVTDLAVTGVTTSGLTLAFTEVDDGTGQPAKYDFRYAVGTIAFGSATDVAQGTCVRPVLGTAIGTRRTCTILGLTSSTGYQVQLVSYRGTLDSNAVFGPLSNVASGTTAASTAPVATVTVNPASASVALGAVQQFAAILKDASGNVLTGRAVSWSSSSPTIAGVSGTGLVTGLLAGSATITATSEGQSGSAAVTVTAAPPPPPPGGTVLVQESFDDASLDARGWYDGHPATISTTEYHGGGGSIESRFPASGTQPSWAAKRHLFTPSPTVYVSFWVKYSTNWVGSGRPYHPHEFVILSDLDGDWDGLSNDYLTAYIEQVYNNGGRPQLALQDGKNVNLSFGSPPNDLVSVTENRSVSGCNGHLETSGVDVWNCFNMPPWYSAKEYHAASVAFQPSPGAGYKSNWNHVEAYYQMNSIVGGIGQADGVVRYWFNGVLMIERTNVLMRTGAHPTLKFKQIVLAPYIGDGSPVDQTVWYDDLIVATSKP